MFLHGPQKVTMGKRLIEVAFNLSLVARKSEEAKIAECRCLYNHCLRHV